MKDFNPGFFEPPEKKESDLFFLFSGGRLLVKGRERIRIPARSELSGLEISIKNQLFLGTSGNEGCYGGHLPDSSGVNAGGLELRGLRGMFGNLDDRAFSIAGFGLQVLNWDRVSRYCGVCGGRMIFSETERAKNCVDCGHIEYPRINPVIIVAVTRNDRILLARSHQFKGSFYSVIAGYVELGETLEQTVEREVFEETGLRIKDIRYFGSQPWPFSNAMMVAFTASYVSGRIVIQESEIAHADWFGVENLPEMPGWGSISRRLIDDFVKKQTTRGKS